MTKLFEWLETRLDEGGWVRRVFLYVMLVMTWKAFVWGTIFAAESTLAGVDRAAVIAAVTAPVCALMKYVFEAYAESRK